MINKILKQIKKIYNIKIRFDLPKSKKILLHDDIHSLVLREIIKKDFNLLKVRKEKEIYFWIFLQQVIFFDFRFLTYCENYIKYTSPKVVITFIDNNIQFYQLKKKFNNIYFISVQNGIRLKSWFNTMELLKSKNLKCDHFFVFNKYYINEYQRIINSKYHILGNFKNNIVKINKTKFRNQFLFISQFVTNDKKIIFKKKLLTLINLYLSSSGKKLHILLRNKNILKQKIEIKFYQKIFKSNCIFQTTANWKKSYEIIDKFENIIFMFSTLGYEAIARKKKVAVFSANNNNLEFKFGWPGPFKEKYDFFSAKNLTYGEIKRVLTNVNNCSQVKWNRTYYKKVKDQLYLSKKNAKLKKVLFKLL